MPKLNESDSELEFGILLDTLRRLPNARRAPQAAAQVLLNLGQWLERNGVDFEGRSAKDLGGKLENLYGKASTSDKD